MISRKLLTNPKLFVDKKHLRSRRAPRASTKSSEVLNHWFYTCKVVIMLKFLIKYYNLVIFIIWLLRDSQMISRKLLQISNYLSKKNIWDPAERLVLVPNHQKSQIIEFTCIIVIIMLKMLKKLWFWDFHFFAMRDSQMISRKLLTNLKLFVGEKYLRSRRAARASTKSSEVPNNWI
jgi:hypothetical protein